MNDLHRNNRLFKLTICFANTPYSIALLTHWFNFICLLLRALVDL